MGTMCSGSNQIPFFDGANALEVCVGDENDLASKLAKLMGDQRLIERIAKAMDQNWKKLVCCHRQLKQDDCRMIDAKYYKFLRTLKDEESSNVNMTFELFDNICELFPNAFDGKTQRVCLSYALVWAKAVSKFRIFQK